MRWTTAFFGFALLLRAESGWFQPQMIETPEMRKTLQQIADRRDAIVEEWIHLVEVPAPSGREQARAKYLQAEMQKCGLTDIQIDSMGNLSGVRKGTGAGPTVVFAAHMDTVFPEGTPLTVEREGDILRAPGVGDDTGNLMATLEMFRALHRDGVKTKGDVVFLASVQEERGLLGAKYWLEHTTVKPDLFIAVDSFAESVWYGALRIYNYRFTFTSKGAHTMESRGAPSPSKAVASAIQAVYAIPLPSIDPGAGSLKLPVVNVGMLGGGTVTNAVPLEAWFTVDLRSLDSATQDRLDTAVVSAAREAAEKEGVGFQMDRKTFVDYSKALPAADRRKHPLVPTTTAVMNHFRKSGVPQFEAKDLGSTDANIAVSMAIPAVAVGAVRFSNPHRLEESAEASSVVRGTQALTTLAIVLANSPASH